MRVKSTSGVGQTDSQKSGFELENFFFERMRKGNLDERSVRIDIDKLRANENFAVFSCHVEKITVE